MLDANSLQAAIPVVRQFVYTVSGALSVGAGGLRLYNRFGVLKMIEVHAAVGTAPTGASILIDVNKNGTTIFTTQSNRTAIAASANTGSSITIEVSGFVYGDYLTVDIDQVGSTVAGSDLTVSVVAR
jgi:hypothetical protein